MKSTKERTIYYRRVNWLGRKNKRLGKYLMDAHVNLASTKKRTFHHGDGEIQGINWSSSPVSNGILFHIAEYVPHQSTSLVPFPSSQRKDKTTAYPPPDKNNFLVGDIFCLLSGNHLLLCPSGAREAVADSYVRYMLRANGNEGLLPEFEISAIANINQISYIKQHGIKSIELDASLYEATMDYTQRKTIRETIMKDISDNFLSLFANDPNAELRGITDKENLQVKLIISFDKRKSGDIGQERLIKASTDIVASGEVDGFKIVTGDNQKFSPDSIRICDKFKIQQYGASVDRDSAWKMLEEYYTQLQERGVLQQ